MTKIEEYLVKNYPDEVCKTLTDLYLERDDLEGEVNLKYEQLPKLERVWYHHNLKILTGLDLNLAVLLEEQKAPKGIFLTVESHVQILKYVPIKERMAELFPDEEKNKFDKVITD